MRPLSFLLSWRRAVAIATLSLSIHEQEAQADEPAPSPDSARGASTAVPNAQWVSLARDLEAKGDIRGANAALNTAYAAGTNVQRQFLELGRQADDIGDAETARQALGHAAEGPDERITQDARALLAELQTGTSDVRMLLDQAYLLKQRKEDVAAERAFKRALKAGANPQVAWLEIAYMRAERHDSVGARVAFETATHGDNAEITRTARSELAGLTSEAGSSSSHFGFDLYAEAFGWHRVVTGLGAEPIGDLVPTLRLRAFYRPVTDLDFAFYVVAQGTRDTASPTTPILATAAKPPTKTSPGVPATPEIASQVLADDYAFFAGGARARVWGGRLAFFAQIGPAFYLLPGNPPNSPSCPANSKTCLDARVGTELFAELPSCAPDAEPGARFTFVPCAEVYGEAIFFSRFDNDTIGFIRPRIAATYLVTGPVAWQALVEGRAGADTNGDQNTSASPTSAYGSNFVDTGIGQRFRTLGKYRVDLILSANTGMYIAGPGGKEPNTPYTDVRLEASTYLEVWP